MAFMAKKHPPKPESSPKDIWQTAESPGPMLDAAKGLLSPRRLRLFAIACCKSLWGQRDAWSGYLELLRLAELMADSDTEKRMSELSNQAARFRRVGYPHGVIHLLAKDAGRAVGAWAYMAGLTHEELKRHTDVLREIAGNPFADIHLDRALLGWRDGTIPKLAQACYDANDFSTLGILGDALEEAGCNERAILEQVRSEQTHYRGCWLVDLILGKK
jgi:hypothetical protein